MFRRALVLVFATCGWLLVIPAASPPSNAADGRTLSATPADGLGNEVVAVSWTGFQPSVDGAYTVTIMQCKGAVPSSLADCYQTFRPPATNDDNGSAVPDGVTQADGTGTSFIEVRPALQLPSLDCTATSPCSLVAFENDGSEYPAVGLPTTAATTTLHFARSPADCPPVDTFDVTTAGEASASQALYSWSAQTCTGADALHVDYTESSSVDGRENFLNGLIDVGIASGPADAAAAAASGRSPEYAPIDLTGVVVAFNVYDAVTGERITDMNLTPRLVAILIAGDQFGGPAETLFSDPEFLAINPGHNWPSSTVPPLLRAERNDDATLLTRWLNTDGAARQFLDGNDSVAEVDPYWKGIDYPTDTFEARDQSTLGSYNPRSGTITNARRLFNMQAPGDGQVATPSFQGLLGVLDAVTARKFGIPTAKLRPASTSTSMATDTTGFVAADGIGLTSGLAAMQSDDATGTKAADVSAAAAYPLTKIDYAMVPTTGMSVEKAAKIAQFVEYASNQGQQPDVLAEGYLPLTTDLQSEAGQVADAVKAGGSDTPPPLGGGDTPPDTADPELPFDPGALGPTDSSDSPSFDDGSTPSDPATGGSSNPTKTSDKGGSGNETAAPLPISKFKGGDGQAILPIVLLIGLAALVFGPGLTWWSGRRRRV
ncbi:MAG: substrate-binding domain-containing protein [Acidimicrobiia bacterium]|nr:substrate-binding domain-containing protein [Acidimicrobiia bacterium]